jgi:fructosamine-3-kinase
MNPLAKKGAALLGAAIKHAETVQGGDLSSVARIVLTDGREAIVKTGPAPNIEAAMLRAIAATGAPAPAVLAVSGEALVIEAVPLGGNISSGWHSLGRELAKLHAASGGAYGWAENYAFGPVPIENGWREDWPAFWSERRLLVHLLHLPAALARRIEALVPRLPSRLPARPKAALLHGDLWGGNILVAHRRVTALIDPACYYGHLEVDIAMLNLFDRPARAFYEAYGPLEAGHEERLVIYQLWPALVHVRLFGTGYRPMVERLLSAAGV